jgi:SAM-dependent methyltransferase
MKIITDTKPRIVENISKLVQLPLQYFEEPAKLFFSSESSKEYNWMYSYNVILENLERAKALRDELFKLMQSGKQKSNTKVVNILSELKKMRLPNIGEMDHHELWEYVAAFMPGDIGGNYKDELTHIISNSVSGDTMEAMCGFNSYIIPHLDRNVTAQDYSENMLLKYEHTKRRRILFDLNLIPTARLELPDNSFDNIVFVKGYKYIFFPIDMFREFYRLLKPNGHLLFGESTTAGYEDVILRELNVPNCKRDVTIAGFDENSIRSFNFEGRDPEELILFDYVKK